MIRVPRGFRELGIITAPTSIKMVEFKGREESIFAVTIVFFALSFITVTLRCFVRLRLVKAFGWDDALMVFAMVPIYLEPDRYDHRADRSSGGLCPLCTMRYRRTAIRNGSQVAHVEPLEH